MTSIRSCQSGRDVSHGAARRGRLAADTQAVTQQRFPVPIESEVAGGRASCLEVLRYYPAAAMVRFRILVPDDSNVPTRLGWSAAARG